MSSVRLGLHQPRGRPDPLHPPNCQAPHSRHGKVQQQRLVQRHHHGKHALCWLQHGRKGCLSGNRISDLRSTSQTNKAFLGFICQNVTSSPCASRGTRGVRSYVTAGFTVWCPGEKDVLMLSFLESTPLCPSSAGG